VLTQLFRDNNAQIIGNFPSPGRKKAPAGTAEAF